MKIIDSLNKACDRLIPDQGIDAILQAVFSKPSLIVHTIWFATWFLFKLDVSLLTNIVSLEAIYLGAFIGIQQVSHHAAAKEQHEVIKQHILDKT